MRLGLGLLNRDACSHLIIYTHPNTCIHPHPSHHTTSHTSSARPSNDVPSSSKKASSNLSVHAWSEAAPSSVSSTPKRCRMCMW